MNKIDRDWAVIILLYFGIGMMALAMYFAYHGYLEQGRTLRTVTKVCTYAHNNSGNSEDACGIAQDTANATFSCGTREITDNCWTETK